MGPESAQEGDLIYFKMASSNKVKVSIMIGNGLADTDATLCEIE